jgi:uncharacterized membrane protein required for colicin V production
VTPVIIDLLLLFVLILFVVTGFRRGLVSSLAGLLSFVIALVGANMLARAAAPTVAAWIAPSIETALVERFQQAADDPSALPSETPAPALVPSPGGAGGEEALEDDGIAAILKTLGIYDRVAQSVTSAARQQASAAGAGAARVLSFSLAAQVAFWALFLFFSIVLRVVLGIVVRGLNLVARLPVLHQLNRLGGLLFGLIQGIIVLFLIAWVLQLFSFRLPAHTLEQTFVLRLLLQSNPFAFLPALPIEIQT